MKKSVLLLTAALSFGAAGAQTAVTTTAAQAPALTDVPAGHWAKDAVERLVSQGIILGYPDGTYRGTQNLTRYEAAMIISRLLDQVGRGDVKLGDLDDATVTSVRNAINELSAELAALDVRVSDLENSAVSREDFARLEGRVDAIASTDGGKVGEQLAAVNEMATLLNQDVLELQDRVTKVDGELASFDERLGVVEDQVSENTTAIDQQGGRIANLENGRVRLTLGVSGGYGRLDRVAGNTDFDVDRVTEGTFAQKQYTGQTAASDTDTRVRGEDTKSYEDGLDTGITLGVKATNIDAGNNIVIEEAGVNFGFDPAILTPATALGTGTAKSTNRYVTYLDSAEVTGRIGDDARFRAVASGKDLTARPDVVNPVGKLADKPGYNDYLLPSGVNNGVTVGATLSDLPYKPTAYVSAGYGNDDNLRGTYIAARTEAKLGDKGDIGVSFVQNNSTVGTGHTAFGVDASYTQNKPDSTDVLYGVKGTYVASMPDAFTARLAGREASFAAVVSGEANFFNLGAKGDFRAVSPGFKDGKANMDVNKDDDNSAGFYDEVGYGASVSTRVGNAEIGVAGDTFTNYTDQDWNNRRSTFGGHVGTNLGALRVVGFGSQAMDQRVPGTTANGLAGQDSGYAAAGDTTVRYVPQVDAHPGVTSVRSMSSDRSNTIFAPGKVTDLYRYTTGVGALVTHDGSAANPLVPNLDLAATGIYNYNSSDYYVAGFGAYNFKPNSTFTVTPFVGASMYQQNAANREGAADNNRVQGGVRVATQPLNYAFKPQFKAGIGAASYTTGAVDAANTANNTARAAATGNQWGGSAEVTLNEFFSPATKLSLGYGYRQVNGLRDNVNVKSTLPADVTDFRFGGTYAAPVTVTDGNYNTTQGIFTQLSWNDALKFNYGVFSNNNYDSNHVQQGDTNIAQGFKVTYGVKF
ncbi:S-layer homology domain-containing protein [Deinococcus sp. Marseille-Q6407]|uniref:S-layer homology domain-containing protein n=1 Tax=Deinococcus sp. Marseille-Q6407 TaxID=2969223 RepID=UPI0021C10AE9|nr:S-layer homology domain-containing protein [Deinococcus sp. Marseille-Q6407]